MPIVRSSKESDAVNYVRSQLDPYFLIREEVQGIHMSGRRKRIDMVIKPKPATMENGFPDIPVGIEIKADLIAEGSNKLVIERHQQAISYRHTRFSLKSGMEFLPLIMLYPPAAHYVTWGSDAFNDGFKYLSDRLAGRFWIGDLFLERDLDRGYYLKMMLCGDYYYKIHKTRGHSRYNANWGFETYEQEKAKLLYHRLTPSEYEKELFKLTELLGM